jgi:hypothetical protein
MMIKAVDYEEAQRRRNAADLRTAIRAFPPDERQEAVANAFREIEADERRQSLMERFNQLSAEDMEAVLSYKKIGEGDEESIRSHDRG